MHAGCTMICGQGDTDRLLIPINLFQSASEGVRDSAHSSTGINGWVQLFFKRYPDLYGHCRRVSGLAVQLAQQMRLDQNSIKLIRRGGLLHDVGKLRVPDSILNKPGTLTRYEKEEMAKHPTHGYEMLTALPFVRQSFHWKPILDIVKFHHERWDGMGYPYGLYGPHIPLGARICAVVDVWDALRSERPYRAAWSKQQVRAHIEARAGTHFDPRVVQAFLQIVA